MSVKGAPEVVLGRCRRCRSPEGTLELDGRPRRLLQRGIKRLAGQGLRVLAVAERRVLVVARPLATAACLRARAVGVQPDPRRRRPKGALAGRAWAALLPAGPLAEFALIGAAALLAGAMHSPIASVALVVELTHSGLALLVPIALAATGATAVSRILVPATLYTAAGWWQAGHSPHADPAHRRSPRRLRLGGGPSVASPVGTVPKSVSSVDSDEPLNPGTSPRHDDIPSISDSTRPWFD